MPDTAILRAKKVIFAKTNHEPDHRQDDLQVMGGMKMKRLTSLLLALVLLLSLAATAFAGGGNTPPDQIDSTTEWSYLDNNSDPAGDPAAVGYNRTAWTAIGFDDSTWKTGAGGFGAKSGGAYSGAAVTLTGCPGDASN